MTQDDPTLLVFGLAADEVAALSGKRWSFSPRVVATSDLDAAQRHVGSTPVLALLVDARRGTPEREAWLTLAQRTKTPLVVVADDEDEALEWMRAGAAGFSLRPGLAGLLPVLEGVRVRAATRAKTEAADARLREASAELLSLARGPSFRGEDVVEAVRALTQTATRGLGVSRCGVWLADEARTHLTQLDLYDARSSSHSSGTTLSFQEHPAYVEALMTQRLLSVPDARHDTRTRGFTTAYFEPVGIHSTLHVGLRLRGRTVGVLCAEATEAPRRWTPGDEVFAGAVADAVSLALEASERARAEAALRQAERRFSDLFRYSSDCIVLYRVTLDGSVVCEDINPATQAASGLKPEQVIGKQAHEVFDGGSASRLRRRYEEAIQQKQPISYEHELSLRSGGKLVFNTAMVPMLDDQGRVYRLAAIARDVTAQRDAEAVKRQLEAQLVDTEKRAAQRNDLSLAAQELSDVLSVVAVHAARVAGTNQPPSPVAQALLELADQGQTLTQKLTALDAVAPSANEDVDLAALARDLRALLAPAAPGVQLDVHAGPERLLVRATKPALHQALSRLVTRSLRALPARGAVTVDVSTPKVDRPGARRWVRVTVSDTAATMEESAQQALQRGVAPEGRQVPLCGVHHTVTALGGFVEVRGSEGGGNVVQLYLPALEASTATATGHRLLLLDDHPGMAKVSAKLLETLGFHTTVFDDPREALDAFRAAPATYDVVLTDMSMPHMSGAEFTRAVQAVRPGTPVIVTSGLGTELDEAELFRLGVRKVLVKPWRVEEALSALRAVLADVRPA